MNSLIRRNISTIFAVISIILANQAGFAQNPAQAAPAIRKALPSVVHLVVRNSKDNSTQTGSGFFIGPDTLVTTFQLINDASEGYAKVSGEAEPFRILGTVGVDEAANLAVLKIDTAVGRPLVLAENGSGNLGDEVFAIGNPQGVDSVFTSGAISGTVTFNNADLLQISAPISLGSAGGPVLNSKGDVLGVAVSYVRDGETYNFAVPVKLLRNLIGKKQGVVKLAGPARTPEKVTPEKQNPPRVTDSLPSAETVASGVKSVSEFDVNGLKVILKRRPNSATVAGGLFIRGGARNITDKNAGIEQLMLSTAVEAGKTIPRQTVRRELSSRGSVISAGASNDYSAISLATTKQEFPRVFDIFAEVVLNPAFADEDIKRNRDLMLTTLRETAAVPEAALETLQDRVLYAGHPYANEVIGTSATISSLTANDLRAYHKKVMETQRLLFVFVGDIDQEQLKSKIAATFGKLPRGNYVEEPYPAVDFSKGSLDVTQRTLPTNYLKGVFAAPSLNNPDYYAMRVAMAVLQTLVYQEVRGRLQLSYAPDAEMESLAANTANISVSTTDPNAATRAMLDQMKLLKERQLNKDVIDEVSSFFLTRYYMGQETSVAQVGELAKYELIGGGWRRSFEFLNGVRAVTGSDVQRVASKYMKNLRFVYVGDTSKIDRRVFVQ